MTALSYRLNEWLALRKYSRAEWYRMPPDEKPDVIGEGRMQRITAEADARWQERQERKADSAKRHTAAA
jgi:hypothetical protein